MLEALKKKFEEIRFFNTGEVKSDACLVKWHRLEKLQLLAALEKCIEQRDRAIMSVPLSGNSEDRYKNEFNTELLTILEKKLYD